MKVWRFYLKKAELAKKTQNEIWINQSMLPSQNKLNKKYPLYAITSDKKKAKKFMEQRDMDVFIMQVSDVSKDEWSKFANQNRGCVLDHEKLHTKTGKVNKDGTDETMKVRILMPYSEKIYLDSMVDDADNPQFMEKVFEKESKKIKFPFPLISTEEVQDALMVLGYFDFYNWYSSNPMDGFEEALSDNGYVVDPFRVLHPSFDELNIYLETYAPTFKI